MSMKEHVEPHRGMKKKLVHHFKKENLPTTAFKTNADGLYKL